MVLRHGYDFEIIIIAASIRNKKYYTFYSLVIVRTRSYLVILFMLLRKLIRAISTFWVTAF